MTDLPIIFSAPMVRALLDGRKTMTRRLAWRDAEFGLQDYSSEKLEELELKGWNAAGEGDDGQFRVFKPTSWQSVKPGDRLWVREAVAFINNEEFGEPSYWEYRANTDGKCFPGGWPEEERDNPDRPRWKTAIHCPRKASRLTLVVIATKIEPLLKISEDDAKAEGCRGWTDNTRGQKIPLGDGWTIQSVGEMVSAAGEFQILWNKLHPDWDGYSSPEVVALTFTVHKINIDQMPKAEAA